MRKFGFALIALAIVTVNAQAGVVYSWEGDTPNEINVSLPEFRIVFTDKAWLAGGASGMLTRFTPCEMPGIESVFNYQTWHSCQYIYFEYDFAIVEEGLTGSFTFYDTAGDWAFQLAGGPIWTVLEYTWGGLGTGCGTGGQDETWVSYPVEACAGATGHWILDLSTVPKVPAPVTLPLFSQPV